MKKIVLISFLNFFICLAGFNLVRSQELKDEAYSKRHSYSFGYGIKKMRTPEVFQGNRQKKKYFEGWYRFVPFMQCYHGVVSLNHNLNGSLIKDNKTYNFDNGLGYIEKDWGKSMPSEWIWMQSNNFNSENTSFMLSVANIPWMGSSFSGFLGFFLHDGTVQRFGTYTHAKLRIDTSHSDTLKITITDKKYTYLIETYRNNSGILIAPVKGAMDRRISESIDAKLLLTVMDKSSDVIFYDSKFKDCSPLQLSCNLIN